MSAPPSAWRATVDRTVIGLFLAAIAAPSIDQLVRSDAERGPLREQRQAAPRPKLSLDPGTLDTFPEHYEAYYNDSLGLRDKLLRWNSIEKLELFHVSPTPKVVLGRDDWIYFTDGRSIEVWRGIDPLTTAELEAWRTMLEWNRDRLRERGVEYVFGLSPNKETIYPERVAARFNRVGPTRMDQLVAYLASHSDLRILDLRPALLEAKREDRPGDELYFRDGTHWNARGALVAYRELVAKLARTHPLLKPLDASRLEAVDVPGTVDSWSNMMYVYDRRPQGARMWRILPHPCARTLVEKGPYGQSRVKVTELDARELPRVLLVHDSFGPSLEGMLAEGVSRLACHWDLGFDVSEVDSEKPDVVVQLLVERVLVEYAPDMMKMKIPPSDRDAFMASRDVIFSLDPAADPPQVTGWSEATCRKAADGSEPAVEIGVRTWKDLALLPEIEPGGSTSVFVDVTAPARTMLLLFYQLDPKDAYLRERSVSVPIEAGRNRVYLRLEPHAIRGRLGLRPGAARGTYLLHGLEIRRLAAESKG
jgi:hypothetical protein